MSTTSTTLAVPTTSDPRFQALSFLARYEGQTREVYAIRLRVFFAWCDDNNLDPLSVDPVSDPEHAVTRPHLELYGRHLGEVRDNARGTVHGALCVLKMFYRLLAIDQVIKASPAEYVRMPKVHRDEIKVLGLAREDLMKMIYTSRLMSPDHGCLVTLMGILGLRVSEACAVQTTDFIDSERGHRVLRLIGKGCKPATIPLPPAVFRELDRCAEHRTGQLLYRIDGVTPLDRRAAYRMIKAVAKRAGVTQRCTPHVLRHSMVSAALDAGCTLRDVQIAARHADPRTTANYDQARRSLDRHPVHSLSAFLSGGA
mgnify:CR=1 FL=1